MPDTALASGLRVCELRDLGRLRYEDALREQKDLEDRRKRGLIPDQLLFVEHPHVVTMGRNGKAENLLASEELMERALALVGKLPRREQDVFALCAWSELSYEDAAIALRIPVGTVRSRLSRARSRLRELDPGYGHERETMQPIEGAVER